MSEEESTPKRRTRRAGGREARKAARAADEGGKVVRPGLPGGNYKPLSESDVQRIHGAALDVLENIGIGDPIPGILDAVLPKGCILGDDGSVPTWYR